MLLVILIASLLLLSCWLIVVIFGLPWWIGVTASAAVVVGAGIFVGVKLLKQRRAAAHKEPQPDAVIDAYGLAPTSDQARIAELRGDFRRSVATLADARTRPFAARNPIRGLPWFLTIGAADAGKSTLIANSGLQFYRTASEPRSAGPTRNCRWWLTEKGVFLDTAGRYATEEVDRSEWKTLLSLIRKTRPKSPLNGVLVTVPVTDLTAQHNEDLIRRARTLRSRIDDVVSGLEVILPVYIVFTKTDALPGFVDLFGNLSARASQQVLGFTVPEREPAPASTTFPREFDALCENLMRHAHHRLTQESDLEVKARIHAFVQHLRGLQRPLQRFFEEFFVRSVSEAPVFRGVYFTSSLQQEAGPETILEDAALRLGMSSHWHEPRPASEPKSYFAGDLLRRVVLADRRLAVRTAARRRRASALTHVGTAALAITALFAGAMPARSYERNRELLHRAVQANRGAASLSPEDAPLALAQIRHLLEELDAHRKDGIPLSWRLGMYQGDRLRDALGARYVSLVRDTFIAPAYAAHVRELQRLAQRAPEDELDARAYIEMLDLLRLVLLLSPPGSDAEPGLTQEQRDWAAARLADGWKQRYEAAPEDVPEARAAALRYLQRAHEEPELLFARDERLVASARQYLQGPGHVEAMLDLLLRDVGTPDLDVRTMTGSSVLKSEGHVIPAAFTRTAWDDVVRGRFERLPELLAPHAWVLGWPKETSHELLAEQGAALRSLYFERYVAHWRAFLASIYLDIEPDHIRLKRALEDLTRGEIPPLTRLCRYVAWNTELGESAPPAEAEQEMAAPDATEAKPLLRDPELNGASSVADAFAGFVRFGCPRAPKATKEGEPAPPAPAAALDQYHDDLRVLRDALNRKIADDGPEQTQALLAQVKSMRISVSAVTAEMDDRRWSTLIEPWLRKPIDAARTLGNQTVQSDMTARWCEDIVVPLRDIQRRYPFAVDGDAATLAQLGELFAPDKGKVWTYASEVLGHVEGSRQSLLRESDAARNEPSSTLDPQVHRFFARARILSEALYAPGATTPAVEFDVNIDSNPAVSETTLDIDGLQTSHRNGPARWVRFRWPGESEQPAATLTARGRQVNGKLHAWGPWALFELLEHGTITRAPNAKTFTVAWDLRDQGAGLAVVRIRPVGERNPFFGGKSFMDVFRHRDLVPPARLIAGGPSCSGR